MKSILVRYKVHPDKTAENEALIRGVFEELRSTSPAGLRYASFKQADGVSFVHVATIDTVEDRNPLPELASFKRFQQHLRDRCVEAPSVFELTAIGLYG